MNHSQQDTTLIWPITQQGKTIAQQFARGHTQPAIAERVRRNTLAVWVIHDFLDAIGIASDLSTSDSWNPVIQIMEDIADLVIPGVGRLECRPVAAQDDHRVLAAAERIGYVAVALDEAVGEASLLGFVAEVPSTRPWLDQLQPMEDFPAHLHHLRQESPDQQPSGLTCLSRWLEGYFDSGWQSAEELLAQYAWTPAFRQGSSPTQTPLQIKQAKQLDLGVTLGAEQVTLVLEIDQDTESMVNIRVRLYPLGGPLYLPEKLTVAVLDETDTVCLTAQARSVDNYLQLYFRGHPGEPFKVQVTLRDVCIVENFII